MHDQTAVEQHPEQTWPDGRPKASPHTQWVVKSRSVVDDLAATTATTSYFYTNPRHGPVDDDRRFAFRGFEDVTTTAPSGAKTIQHYDYATDPSGRRDKTVVGALRGPDRRPFDRQDHVASVHPIRRRDQDLSRDDGRAFHVRQRTDRGEVHGDGRPRVHAADLDAHRAHEHDPEWQPPLLWQETASLLQAGPAAADGDRQTVRTFALHADGTTYRLRPLTSERQHRVGGTMTMFGKTAKTWDADLPRALDARDWFNTNDANRAIARSAYDMTTGNMTQRWKPKQNAAHTTYTAFAYDAAQALRRSPR